jgi:glycosyltransferase involved in cell wall biosynthesis
MPDIRFSIIITSYNQPEFIKDAVDSALSQRPGAAEIIVVDDASTDGTQDVLRQYGDAIRLVCRETNGKCSVARNCGAALAKGEYLVFLDGDDALLPWALDVYEQIVEAKNPKMICCASLRYFQGTLPAPQAGYRPPTVQIVEYADYLRKDRTAANSGSAMVIEHRVFERVGGWPEDIWPNEHEDLMLKLGDCGRMVLILTPLTTLYRVHANNTVKNVPAFLPSLYKLIHNERLGKYPGGTQRRFQRYALIGGYVLTWQSRAIKRGLYGDTLTLLAHAWPMTFAAVTRKLRINLKRRQSCETIKM